MRTKTITTWTSVVAIAALLAGTAAVLTVAAPGEAFQRGMGPRWQGPPGPPGTMQLGRFLRDLDLTQEQRDTIRESMMNERESHRDLFERLSAARKNLQDAVLQGEDESVLSQLAQTVGGIESEAALAQARQFANIVAILEPEQLAKLKDLVAQEESRAQERQERFRQGRPEREQEDAQ